MERLKRIKLTNFKSFADSTTIPITSRLTAIVGPNGCGKSNVVDAVRWVIGESSAKQLRGQSMADVIFNGTTEKKPVGKASVELEFDNSDGWIGGEYLKFSVISIKREVEREGVSSYFINGTLCKRKDILHVFLGTGLGSRSYAIIEQGMISRLVEAKPEDMRAHLEEVAGISKYKDRRRETENRMRRTNENLERVNDIIQELATQLRRLKRQANAAERYQVLKQEEQTVNAQIKALQWQALEDDKQVEQQRIAEGQVRYDEQLSLQRQVEVDIESSRAREVEVREILSLGQKQFYAKAADIARIEQQIKNIQEQTNAWKDELEETKVLLQEVTDSSQEQREQKASLSSELQQLSPRKQSLHDTLTNAKTVLQDTEETMRQWQSDWDQFQQQFNQDSKQHAAAKTSLGHLAKQIDQESGRLQQLHKNKDSAPIYSLEQKIEPLQLAVEDAQGDHIILQQKIDLQSETFSQQRQMHQNLTAEVRQLNNDWQQKNALLISLEALQQAALSDEVSQAWLNERDFADAPRLGNNLQVESGWELAVETVLSQQFNAVCLDSFALLEDKLHSIQQGKLVFMERCSTTAVGVDTVGEALSGYVNCDWDLSSWLNGISAVETLEQALSLRANLKPDQSIVTRDGIWVGANWIRVARAADDSGSVLLRKQEIEQAQHELMGLRSALDDKESSFTQSEQLLLEIECTRDELNDEFKSTSSNLSRLQSELSALTSRLSELQSQQQRLLTEIEESLARRNDLIKQHDTTDIQLRERSELVIAAELKREGFISTRVVIQKSVSDARQVLAQAKQEVDQVDIRFSANEDQVKLLAQTLDRQDRQIHQLQERHDYLSANLKSDSDCPLNELTENLQNELDQHVIYEKSVKQAEEAVQHSVDKMSAFEKDRAALIRVVNSAKDQIQTLQMKSQELIVRQATIAEQLNSMDIKLQEILPSIPDEANLVLWGEKSESLARRISKLGMINLGAIEEYDTLSERKNFLDAQYADLKQALQTLDEAIKKIDRETKSRFKDTYEKVNAGFKELFPKIFGGGSAYLELEENDYLTSGVLLKAQPPGKRNTPVQMLSGGEKALAAIALVFALFRLNPAPFCILDEVDAPLDDVNVGRFCELVKEMSAMTQFLMISHNKVSISMADHLMGVTMHEAGVSRIVSVDVEAAIEMAEA